MNPRKPLYLAAAISCLAVSSVLVVFPIGAAADPNEGFCKSQKFEKLPPCHLGNYLIEKAFNPFTLISMYLKDIQDADAGQWTQDTICPWKGFRVARWNKEQGERLSDEDKRLLKQYNYVDEGVEGDKAKAALARCMKVRALAEKFPKAKTFKELGPIFTEMQNAAPRPIDETSFDTWKQSEKEANDIKEEIARYRDFEAQKAKGVDLADRLLRASPEEKAKIEADMKRVGQDVEFIGRKIKKINGQFDGGSPEEITQQFALALNEKMSGKQGDVPVANAAAVNAMGTGARKEIDLAKQNALPGAQNHVQTPEQVAAPPALEAPSNSPSPGGDSHNLAKLAALFTALAAGYGVTKARGKAQADAQAAAPPGEHKDEAPDKTKDNFEAEKAKILQQGYTCKRSYSLKGYQQVILDAAIKNISDPRQRTVQRVQQEIEVLRTGAYNRGDNDYMEACNALTAAISNHDVIIIAGGA